MRFKKSLLALLALALLLPIAPLTFADDVPTLGFLSFGRSPAFALTEKAVLDVLEVYGYISADERQAIQGGSDLQGQNINILYRDAGFDMATANLMVEDALDEGADVLLTISTQVGMIAAGALQEMEDPPVLIFAIVSVPYSVGIAQNSCLKPPNVTGTQMDIDFAQFEQVRLAQSPDSQSLGLILNPDDPAGEYTHEVLTDYAAAIGFELEVASAISAADHALAADALLDKGVDAIVMPPRTGSSSGFLAVVETAYGVPVFSVLVTDVFIGGAIGTGFQGWYHEGAVAARMLVGHLRGELDIARTAINLTPGFTVAVNLDAAEAHGVDIRPELLELADFVIEAGEGAGTELEIPGVNTFLEEMPLEERIAADQAFLAELHCTDEMIAEQQAALVAASG